MNKWLSDSASQKLYVLRNIRRKNKETKGNQKRIDLLRPLSPLKIELPEACKAEVRLSK